MPYERKGKCVYLKSSDKKVGCSESIPKAKKYINALHINVKESKIPTFAQFFESYFQYDDLNKNIYSAGLSFAKSKGYSAVVLDDESRSKLLNDPQIKEYINPDHEIIAHHMTIKMGGLMGTHYESRLNQQERLNATDIGLSDDGNVIAVKVDGESTNKIPHITISVNRKSGAKPKDSNNITNWKELTSPIDLTGIVKEL